MGWGWARKGHGIKILGGELGVVWVFLLFAPRRRIYVCGHDMIDPCVCVCVRVRARRILFLMYVHVFDGEIIGKGYVCTLR